MQIKQTTKLQYEYDGRIYDSFEELKKGEQERIDNIVCDIITNKADEYNKKMLSFVCTYSMRDTYKRQNLERALKQTDLMLYALRKTEVAQHQLDNDLREYAWRISYA